jgi:hypothetical protein
VMPSLLPPARHVSPEGYRDRLVGLRGLVQACRMNASACDAGGIGDDDEVDAPGGAYQVRWPWLRKLIDEAKAPGLENRDALLEQAEARLDEELAALKGKPPATAEFAPARRVADGVLARPEFRVVTQESWWDRQMAKFWDWVDRMFGAATNLGKRSPWLGTLLEWGFMGLTAAALVFWVWRTMGRERMQIAFPAQAAAPDWQKESAGWAERAGREAEAGNWREAIHCVYWASIVALESRRLWRRNYARTPREYLGLLEPGSPQKIALGSLTGLFERIWYGLRAARREDYARALAIFEDLRRA